MAKKNKVAKNNKQGVPNDKADEIFKLSHKELVLRSSLEYANWQAVLDQKKNDGEITRIKASISDLSAEINSHPDYVKAKEELAHLKESLLTEEQARFEEELKNVSQPYNEDIKAFRDMFRLCMDEIKRRKDKGLLVL
jgi:phosphoglycerate-specific signal transduction histidine kinase